MPIEYEKEFYFKEMSDDDDYYDEYPVDDTDEFNTDTGCIRQSSVLLASA